MNKKLSVNKNGKSTNNFILKLWSAKHFDVADQSIYRDVFSGYFVNTKTQEKKFFHNTVEMLSALQVEYKKLEKQK